MFKEKLVLIGNGMAGVRTIEEILTLASDRYDITIFGAEPYGNYNRILLSPVLANEKNIDEIMINDDQWYTNHNITLYKGKKVINVNRKTRTVYAEDGTEAKYDRLIIATGSNPFIIPVPGKDLPGVVSFRDIHDVEMMVDTAKRYKNAVVIGGGLLGLEAANGLLKHGMNVTVVHLLDNLMEKQLDGPASTLLKQSLQQRGIKFLMEAATSEIIGNERVEGISFKDGTKIPADIIVMTVGIQPNIKLAKKIGLQCDRGILVSDTMQTFDPRIYAVGECIQHRKQTYGLVAPLYEQAKVCANHLAHLGIAIYGGSTLFTKLKVTGIDLFSASNFVSDEQTKDIVFKDETLGIYKRLVIKDNKLQGVILYGDTNDSFRLLKLIQDKTDISKVRDELIFGSNKSDNSKDQVEFLSNDTEICGCNGVCKGVIIDSIVKNKLKTVNDVRAYTKASSSCGSCTPLVEQLLELTTGKTLDVVLPSLCKCTNYSDDDIRKAIIEQKLKTILQTQEALGWKTPDGCAKCRPALNYYLVCAWPGEYDDIQSRIVNERLHANIQQDGTYSVIPRIWGGVTTAQELHAIANVAEKFQVPTVKITGGQRIDLLGIKREQLPMVWKDLSDAGFVSGHAYGKAIRTVKTCVGKEWCRFGVQDSTRLGILIEKFTWGAWTPHKVKMAVSGCPRNCAEVTIKDFGAVCVESGYQLYVGGNGGIKVRVADLLCSVSTEEDVLEYVGAYLQFYREDAHYFERTSYWIERVGIDYVKEKLFVEKDRKEYYNRFVESQKHSQNDPWKERAEGLNKKLYTSLGV